MTDKPKPAPHPAAANDAAHAKPAPKKASRPAAPKPAIPRVDFHLEPAQSKGKVAMAVATTVGAIGMVGYGIARVAGSMLRRGR